MAPDLVPVYEEHAARIKARIDLQTWAKMDPLEKALIIAQVRIEIAMSNHQAQAEKKHAEREAKKHKGKGKR